MKRIIKGFFTLIVIILAAGVVYSCFAGGEEDDERSMIIACAESIIKDNLIDPSSAEFPWDDDDWHISQEGEVYKVTVEFEAENAYGAISEQMGTVEFRITGESDDGGCTYIIEGVNIYDSSETYDGATSGISDAEMSFDKDACIIPHGTLLRCDVDGNTLKLKVEITDLEINGDHEMAIRQNYYNVDEIIWEQGGEVFDRIEYRAVMKMPNGKKEKAVSFSLSKEVISNLYAEIILADDLGEYADNLYINPKLQ